MSIQILPARLANQIAAGEVVERPASVIKELVENSIDAQATSIKIDIDKGGVKSIRIADNGIGIVKDELTLALSRHATSKIKSLNDLEGINSLGFRGEALASISSVSRLTLTSKPEAQEQAWQACAEGRDMDVTIQPAAHPNGTTIEVNDLFFNTPARRKFLRTEKTEFSHIDEVIRRVALANNHVSFVLTHNGKTVRQYRAAANESQQRKRVAQICGQRFMEHAIRIDCQHDNMHLAGWLASPEFYRPQNDLCYSYVNDRMMRDKLINHAIRQSYSEFLPTDVYPAFVLFLTVDVRDVDVNVHPAKHEVRFHQGRYVHDFIYSVCHKSLTEQLVTETLPHVNHENDAQGQVYANSANTPEYITPLAKVDEPAAQFYKGEGSPIDESNYQSSTPNQAISSQASNNQSQSRHSFSGANTPSRQAVNNYQNLLATLNPQENITDNSVHQSPLTHTQSIETDLLPCKLFSLVEDKYALVEIEKKLRLLSLPKISEWLIVQDIAYKWQKGIVSQPLLLPVKLSITPEQQAFIEKNETWLALSGIKLQNVKHSNSGNSQSIQIREFPAMLREKDVTQTFYSYIDSLMKAAEHQVLTEGNYQKVLASLTADSIYTLETAQSLIIRAHSTNALVFIQQLTLNSTELDLTSAISCLK